jgi:hypothetical protein
MTTNGADDRPGAPRHMVEAPSIQDELYQAFPEGPAIHGFDPQDGLPRPMPANSIKDAEAPDLDPERFVCMGDYSTFVLRDEWGVIEQTFTPAQVRRTPIGAYRVPVKGRTMLGFPTTEWLEVEPVRPQCHHYARQLTPFPDDPEYSNAVRLCTARRTDEGEFLSLGNTQVLACELREPPYGNEQEKIDVFDAKIIADVRAKKAAQPVDDFDVTAALAAEKPKGTPS